jgi:cytochrome c oxidase accessory protein FixG
LFSAWTGFTFVGYFTPIRELSVSLINFSLGPWETFWILFYGFATYGNAGFLREQVCIYMCPYARFQSAMFDRNTLIISYDETRGEPRGPRARSVDREQAGIGDCIDCTLCVQVCPTGIDIRDGLQYQCIACAACVDVCNTVMDKMGYPRGLIRYTTENELEGKPRRLLRPRVIVYTVLLAAIGVGLLLAVLGRVPLELDVIRDRNVLYRETNEGMIENVYTLKVMNMDANPHSYSLMVTGIDGMLLRMDQGEIRVASGEVVEVPVSVRVERSKLTAYSQPIRFGLQAREDAKLSIKEEARFLGPVK